MKTLLITLPMLITLAACSTKDADTGAEDDEFTIDGDESSSGSDDESDSSGGDSSGGGGVMNAVPACDLTGALCYSFDGPLWPAQDTQGFCGQISAQYEAEGAPPMTYIAEGCPSGAMAECTGILMGADESGNPVDGSDVTVYYYQADQGGQLSSACTQQGGTFSDL